jgi:hypothetical protein
MAYRDFGAPPFSFWSFLPSFFAFLGGSNEAIGVVRAKPFAVRIRAGTLTVSDIYACIVIIGACIFPSAFTLPTTWEDMLPFSLLCSQVQTYRERTARFNDETGDESNV